VSARPIVLYVDDERTNRVVFQQSLGDDFEIIGVADGTSALDVMDEQPIAVLVTDMRMPGMTGEELLRIAKERHPRTIRIVITAHSDIEPILRSINEGLVARYIIKPWERTELVQILRWACEAWAFQQDAAELHQRLIYVERLATLGNIASSLVHDLKTPLMSILANAEHLAEIAKAVPLLEEGLARLQLPAADREELQARLHDIAPVAEDLKTSTWHLDEIVNRIRALGRPNDGAPSRGATWSEPLPIVRHAMAVCQPLAITGRASIKYDGPPSLPKVRIASTELTQVLINVVANGAQAVAARGEPHGSVSIAASSHDGMLELKIKDDGVGMSAETLGRIGTPFFTTRAEGTGLGIAQCQRLVGTAGGRFRIDSELGKGTIVTILLPTA
jgi:signal transduction histidine kinase